MTIDKTTPALSSVEADALDARRYRAIRNASAELPDRKTAEAFYEKMLSFVGNQVPSPELYDAAIDAAMQAEKGDE